MFWKIIIILMSVIQGVFACETFIRQQEKLFGIPENLLRSVAIAESGRSDQKGNQTPWPWTINVNGQGYVFSNKQEAINAIKKFQKNGVSSIDVGCMQVNLKHHPNAFRNLSDSLDPQLNVAYAARYLKELKQNHQSWHAAVAHYHSATPQFHKPYRSKVVNIWEKIRKKKGITTPALQDVQFMTKEKVNVAEKTFSPEPFVRFTTYEHVASTQKIQPTAPVLAPPGNFIPLNARTPINARVKVKTHTYTIHDNTGISNGKVFYPLRS